MSDDPFELAAAIATLTARLSVEAVRFEYKGASHQAGVAMLSVREGIAAIKSGSADRMRRALDKLKAVELPA